MADVMERPAADAASAATHVDVLIVGAGISGVGSAYHLQTQCPGKSYAILEAKDTFGGTWETHKYPGVRSDSDLYTFGYRFKPWVGAPIASAEEILKYMGEVIDENGIGEHIRDVQRIFRPVFDAQDVKPEGGDFDHLFKDGEHFRIGGLDVEVMHLPGHTPADIAYRIGGDVFVGDTIFMHDYGTARADFPGGAPERGIIIEEP